MAPLTVGLKQVISATARPNEGYHVRTDTGPMSNVLTL